MGYKESERSLQRFLVSCMYTNKLERQDKPSDLAVYKRAEETQDI